MKKWSDWLGKTSDEDCFEYLELCSKYSKADLTGKVQLCKDWAVEEREKAQGKVAPKEHTVLDEQWYGSLKKDFSKPDYSVYGAEDYVCETWACWQRYTSEKMLRVVPFFQVNYDKIKTITDLGCGSAYTTAALTEILPNAKVTGTNTGGTPQFDMNLEIGKNVGFEMISSEDDVYSKLGHQDCIFAMEFFEHIDDPFKMIDEIHAKCTPKYIVCANTFEYPSIGHFNRYPNEKGEYVDGFEFAKLWKEHMANLGYKQVNESYYENHKPQIWELI